MYLDAEKKKEFFTNRIADIEKDLERLKTEREAKVKEFNEQINAKEEQLAKFKDLLAEVKFAGAVAGAG